MKKSVNIFGVIGVIGVITLLLGGAYYLGTTQSKTIVEKEIVEEIPEGYVNTYSQGFKENYIDTNSIESVLETKDGFQICANDGNIFSFDCPKEKEKKNLIPLENCIPLEDIAYCYINENGYICFELADIGNQLDNPNNRSYIEIMESLQ